MREVKLKKLPRTDLAEIFQAVDTKFSFVNANYEQVSVEAKCRDFLGDCLYSKYTKAPVNIWSFVYNYETHPYDEDVLRLSLRFPDKESQENFMNNIKYLYHRETLAKTKLTEVILTDDPDTLVVEADKHWQSSVWKISLYTFYLKLMCYKDLTQLQEPENKYNTELTTEKEVKMLLKVTDPEVSWENNLASNHNRKGFFSILTNQNPKDYNTIFGGVTT